MLAVRQHVLDRGDDALGLQVAAAHAEGTGIQRRHVLQVLVALELGIGPAVFAAAVLEGLGQSSADFPHQRQVRGQRLVGALEHGDALAAFEHFAQQVAREWPEHHDIDDADFDAALLAHPVRDRLGRRNKAALADDQVIGVVGAVGHDPVVSPTRQFAEVVEGLVRDGLHVVEEIRPLRRHALHVGILVLHRARQNGVVHVPQLGDAAAFFAVDDLLRRRRRVDNILGPAEVFGNQFTFRDHQRLDQVRREEAILADDAGGQCLLGDPVRHDVEVRHGLGVLGHHLEEAGVVDAVVVVVAGVHVQRCLGNSPTADVQHIGEAFADGRIQIFMHVGDALTGREVGRPQPGHRHACRHGCGCMLAFGLDEY